MLSPLLLFPLLLGAVKSLPQSDSDVSGAAALAEGLSAEVMEDAWPSRDLADIQNWYGTSLFGWNGCDKKGETTNKDRIIEAYSDANKLVNYEGVKEELDFNSAAALQFLGPSGLNKEQQARIQNVFYNLATMKEGAAWFTPNWLRVRCDDPRKLCSEPPSDPDEPSECPPVFTQDEADGLVGAAYATNPNEKGNDRFSEINFCPPFFGLRNLGNAMAYGSGRNHPILKADLTHYEGRADTFLHEMLHLDLAANSKNGSDTKPDIRDLLIKYTVGSGKDKGKVQKWTTVYGPRLAKILAGFQPWRRDQSLGYFIERSDDSYSMFALAKYVQTLYGFYPYIPIVYDQISDLPLIPPRRKEDNTDSNELDESDVVAFQTSDNEPATLLNFTQEAEGGCPTSYENGSGEDLEIGPPHDKSSYPDSYWEQYDEWVQMIKNYTESGDDGGNLPDFLTYEEAKPGEGVKPGTELRILCVGDSITFGRGSSDDGGDGNGYRLRLRQDLSKDKVFFAGTESSGTMENGNYAAWSGKSIKYMADHVGPSLKQRPNIILLHAGTNDLDDRSQYSTEGNDPQGIADRLGDLIDQMVKACPDAVILVAMIIDTCDSHKAPRHDEYVSLIPGIVNSRRSNGDHVIAVDFSHFPMADLRDCIHPTNDGYKLMGDYWYDFVTQIPEKWIVKPVGPDPDLSGAGSDENGGVATDIPGPDYGNPIVVTSKDDVAVAYEVALKGYQSKCKSRPTWKSAGKIATGVGSNGLWKFTENWGKAGKVFDGISGSATNVRFHDMDGDGKADYVWLDADTGRLECYLNNLPDGFVRAGTHEKGVIAAGTAPAAKVYLADLDGDGLSDYLVLDPSNGSVDVWWNKGPSTTAPNGWDWAKGGQIAEGALHANLATLRFPDINGDGRADYVFIGKGGSLGNWENTGTDTGRTIEWVSRHGIATGETYNLADFSKLVLADIDGDGRDDYLVFDSDSGLSGFLNQPSNREGVPRWIKQADKAFAVGIKENHNNIHLADMDGNGKVDYIFVDDNGAVNLWHNRGSADTSMAIYGLRFADIDGDGMDDYIWVDPETGAPSVRLNMGFNGNDQLGWGWKLVNDGNPIARGTAPGVKVRFADIDGNGRADYIVIDPDDGGMRGWLNGGPTDNEYGWSFVPQDRIFEGGIGPGANVRLADIDGDGFDDYIYLHPGGRTTIYQNKWNKDNPTGSWVRMEDAEAKQGIQRRPEEIIFHDINGDGKADYLWVNPVDGIVHAWINNYPNSPAWVESGEYAGSVGTAGANIRFAKLQPTGRASLVVVDPSSNAIGAWLNGCDDLDTSEKKHMITITHSSTKVSDKTWSVTEHPLDGTQLKDYCDLTGKYNRGSQISPNDPSDAKFPASIRDIDQLYGHDCYYTGTSDNVGRLRCDGVGGIHCYKDPHFGDEKKCDGWSYTLALYCTW